MALDRSVDKHPTIPPSLVAGQYRAVQVFSSDEASAPTMFDLGVSCHRLGWHSSGRHNDRDMSHHSAFPNWQRGWWSAERAAVADHEAAAVTAVIETAPKILR